MFELATWGFWNCFIVSRKNGTVIHDYFWGIWCYCVPLELVVYSIFRQTQFEHWKKGGAAAVYSGNFGHLSSNSGDTIYTYVYSEYCITLYSMNMIYKIYIYICIHICSGETCRYTHIFIYLFMFRIIHTMRTHNTKEIASEFENWNEGAGVVVDGNIWATRF